jgi:hypothetical protein
MPKFRCEHCRQKISAPADYAGRRVRCPRCKEPVRVPEEVDLLSASSPPPAGETAAASRTPSPAPDVSQGEPPSRGSDVPAPSAAPFAGEVQGPILTRRVEGNLSSFFSDLGESAFDPAPHDLSPEEQTQDFWHLQEVAGYHDAPPAVPSTDFFSEPLEPALPQFAVDPVRAPEPEPAPAPEPIPDPEPPPAATPEPVVLEPAEVIDAPVQRRRPGLNSADEVADLLRRLDKPTERARLAADWVLDRQQRTPPRGSSWIGVLGWASLLIGLGAIGLAFRPAQAKFAIPVGAAGMVLALAGLVLALGRRARVLAPIAGTLASAGGVAVAVLVAKGYLPPSSGARLLHPPVAAPVRLVANSRSAPAEGQTPAPGPIEYVPATSPVLANHVEVRVASALVLRPAMYSGDFSSLTTAGEPCLQITIELKKSGAGKAAYQPWRKQDGLRDEARVTDSAGAILPLVERAYRDLANPVPLAAGALRHPVNLGLIATPDVLLFEPPTDPSGDLLLDLPGANIGAPGLTLHIRIPAATLRVQPVDASRPSASSAPPR